MFSHVMVGATNIEESRKFYDAIMPTIGGKPGVPHKLKGILRYLYFHKGNIFIITEPINGSVIMKICLLYTSDAADD